MVKLGKKKTAMLAYPGFGYPIEDQQWRLFVSGFAWNTPIVFTRRQKLMIRMLGNVMRATPEEMSCERFQNRIAPFMAEADTRRRVMATISGEEIRLKKKTKRNGHFRNWIIVDDDIVQKSAQIDESGNRTIKFSISLLQKGKRVDCGVVEGTICLLERKGISVVSDIDDTIKVSSVGDRRELLNNTFLREFECVDGMVDTYQNWANHGASFHYVSSSPWQLFESLQDMQRNKGLPAGTMHLKNFRLREEFLKKIMVKRKGKKSAIKSLIKKLPDRDFVLIGDSGEKDPEIYRKICKACPDRIKGMFIRELPFRPMDKERMRKLQEVMQGRLLATFSNGKELAELARPIFELQQPVLSQNE